MLWGKGAEAYGISLTQTVWLKGDVVKLITGCEEESGRKAHVEQSQKHAATGPRHK
jgi:hypothetical protein